MVNTPNLLYSILSVLYNTTKPLWHKLISYRELSEYKVSVSLKLCTKLIKVINILFKGNKIENRVLIII